MALPPTALPAAAIELAPYRAVYTLSLAAKKAGSDIAAASGRISIEETEACDGWTVGQRFQLKIANNDGNDVELSSSFASWESKDGLHFRFTKRDLKDGKTDKELAGEAELKGLEAGGEVRLTKPTAGHLDLPAGTVFPTRQTLLLLERAAAGDNFFATKIFDGTADSGAEDVTAVIGARQEAPAEGTDATMSPLLRHPAWPVHLAFFNSEQGHDTPDFEIEMRLLDNGITHDMVLDYGDFSVKALLERIEMPAKPTC